MKKLRSAASAFSMLTLAAIGCTSQQQEAVRPPNIIYIYADDMGVGDIGCYGQQYIKTPNIDRMAQEGMRFTQHYTGAPICAPARCCLLTGRHSGNAFIRNNFELPDTSDYETGQLPIPDETITIAEVLKQQGYKTGIIGKWGLGSINSTGNPNKQGFDFFYGYADQVHAHNYYPTFLWRNGEKDYLQNNVPSVHPKYGRDEEIAIDTEYQKFMGPEYSIDLMTREAIGFIDKNSDQPFFLYLPFTTPHKALQVPDESLEMYADVFEEKPYNGKSGYTPHPKPLSAFAAMITRLDEKIGEIMYHIQQAGLDENTLIMFSSDNGPAGGGGLNPRFFNSSAGLRGSKGQVYEGGIRAPFIARWPGKIPQGEVTDHVSAQFDLMATVAELAGQQVENTDGVSMVPVLLGDTDNQKQHEYLYWEFPRGKQIAVRLGDFKGVKYQRGPDYKWEVYNLAEDEYERENIADEHAGLINRFEEIVKRRTPSHIDEWNF